VQTIYDTFGSKAGVLKVMPDLIDEEAEVHELVAEIESAAPGEDVLALYARLRRQIRERCGDMISLLRSGACVEREVAETLAEGVRRRRYGLERIAQRLADAGALKEGLSPRRAADIASALVCDEVCDILVTQCNWEFDDYEQWVRDSLATSLLRR
jgi:hypothetical protein